MSFPEKKLLLPQAIFLCAVSTLSIAAQVRPSAQPASAQDASAQDSTTGLLQRLSNAFGPSGFEEPVRKLMVTEMKPYANSLRFDGMGSIIAEQGSEGPRVMIDAHMDELGGMVRRITPNGLLTMQMLGGWFDQALVDQRWIILGSKGPVNAIAGIRDIHVVPLAERNQVFTRDSLFLDIGAKTADEVRKMGIGPGDPIVPDSPFMVLNGTGNYLGKAWDDRAGCAIIIEAMRRLAQAPHRKHLFYAVTTQEEIGLREPTPPPPSSKPISASLWKPALPETSFPVTRRSLK